MDPTYDNWVFHGEAPNTSRQDKDVKMTDAYEMYNDAYLQNYSVIDNPNDYIDDTTPRLEENEFTEKVKAAETSLYLGCSKYTKMSATVALYKHKIAHGLSDNGFNELLQIICDMLPEDNVLPGSLHLVKKLLKDFDSGYKKIHACVNDCCLFTKEKENLDTCPKCNTSRWQVNSQTKKIRTGVPAKVLRYFPIIPRLRKMFMSCEKVEQLKWHSINKSSDGKMRHPVDSVAWDNINKKWSNFASDPRNIRFGLAADGFNPFSNFSSVYSCWPIFLVTYNLPPWVCMSEENIMLTLLIPGPKQPGNDIDVFLEPLIDDLIELWNNGVQVYDSLNKSAFKLKAILMWTINDFPAYGNLAGCTTKGELACPICGPNVCSEWLANSKKMVYRGHRRFLHPRHEWRIEKKDWFDGKEETRRPPKPLTGEDIDHVNIDDNLDNNLAPTPQSFEDSTTILNTPTNGDICKLLNWLGTGEVVAKGMIAATNPEALVHHVQLGPDYYKVWVDEVNKPSLSLVRPTQEFFNLGDAKGSTIAWPIKYITLD
ncbi:uncharacterized protein LOC112097937 [Citrus clementina]|uniref:uncharacterized protein LOC112097937 n=1 Tax=Citrus clementina TaxID=85681 RepID=UPI000CED3CE6|nr:uncharacterized protein LOC112097937 [Citrus x clementina]